MGRAAESRMAQPTSQRPKPNPKRLINHPPIRGHGLPLDDHSTAAARREPLPPASRTTMRADPYHTDYGAPAGVVREDNVADIRPPTSSAADIRVSNSINLHLLHGVPCLSLSMRLDRITPSVLRRLGALPIHSKLLSKILKPHLSSYKKELRKITDEELKPYRDNISIIDRAIRWVRLIADLAIITVSTLIVAIVFYSQMYPLKWRARVDGLIDDLAHSLKYKTLGGWPGRRPSPGI